MATVLTDDLKLLSDEAEIVAVGSRSLDKARAFAAEHAIRNAYGDYLSLVADPEVDVVYVSSPHNDHLGSSRLALEAGKAVLCEKPLTVSYEQTRELVDLARSRNLFLMEAVWMRTNPIMRKAAELVHSGELGPVRHASAQFGFSFDGDDAHRLLNPDLAGGGILDLGVYPAHAVDLFLGEPAEVRAAGSRLRTGVDGNATALLVYPATDDRLAATATVHCTLESSLDVRLEVLCRDGRIEIGFFIKPEQMQVWRAGEDEPETFQTQLSGRGYTFQLQEVHRCLRSGELETPLVPWASTLGVARTLDAWMAGVR